MLKVLVAHQTSVVRCGLRAIIESESDFVLVGEVGNGYQAQRLCLQTNPHVAVIDSCLRGPTTSSLLESLFTSCPKVSILILTSSADSVNVRELVQMGVSGCILQSESENLIAQAVRTVAFGAVGFSKCFMVELMQKESDILQTRIGGSSLTSRESEVVMLVADGMSNRQIAHSLSVTERTIEFHISNVFQKLNMDSRVAVALWVKGLL